MTNLIKTVDEMRLRILDAGRAGVCEIFTDGGCDPNPGHGGWGVVVVLPSGKALDLCGGAGETTNNRMELTAILMALRCLPAAWRATIFSDSQYAVKGVTSWMPKWKRAGWVRPASKFGPGGMVTNLGIWQALDAEPARARCSFEWLKGHAGHVHNERADELATIGRQAIIDGEISAIEIPPGVLAAAPTHPAQPARLL